MSCVFASSLRSALAVGSRACVTWTGAFSARGGAVPLDERYVLNEQVEHGAVETTLRAR